jgi:uncharacterized protein
MNMGGLGIGILYSGALARFLETHAHAIDFVSVIPERCWVDHGTAAQPRFVPLPDEVAALDALGERYPLVAHGTGLSIASACTFDVPHLEQLAHWRGRFDFRWVSEHLSAVRGHPGVAVDHHAGIAQPLPWDEELLALVVERAIEMRRRLGCRVLFENAVVPAAVTDCDMGEPEFINRLCRASGCGVLLDLHSLHVNAVNLGFEVGVFLDALELEHVEEVHVAGGNELHGIYLDSHAGTVPDPVWRALDRVLPRCPSLRGITFELDEAYYAEIGDEGIAQQLSLARGLWERHRGACR